MNNHLHLFNFYDESHEPRYLENNLTRALALCLKNEQVLLFAFLKEILNKDDFNYLFYTHEVGASIDFDMQVETNNLLEDTRKLYAIGLTDSQFSEDWSNISDGIVPIQKQNITDLVITIKDIRIIIEVKKYNHDCKEQLRQQISPFLKDKTTQINTRHLSWSSVLNMIEQVSNFYNYNGHSNQFINSFLDLIKSRFNHWLPTKPFKFIPFSKSNSDIIGHEMLRRLLQSIHSLGNDKVDSLWDRTAIKIERPWATEAIPEFWHNKDDKKYLVIRIWPGNTKQQGNSLYSMPMEWVNITELVIDGVPYELYVERHIKFMHFNKYITSIEVPIDETDDWLKKEINTRENHYGDNLAGKWYREKWEDLDLILQDHFKVDWKKECGWHEHFEDTNRSYLTLSLGYTVTLYIPYEQIQTIDKDEESYKAVGIFLDKCKNVILDAIESK
ncbi:MAG: hypothetical protein KF744_14415 [Taibaiella sp.]|nr:hypothetical protein [Taibaiella sp.]